MRSGPAASAKGGEGADTSGSMATKVLDADLLDRTSERLKKEPEVVAATIRIAQCQASRRSR
jgi:hypothetical protein